MDLALHQQTFLMLLSIILDMTKAHIMFLTANILPAIGRTLSIMNWFMDDLLLWME